AAMALDWTHLAAGSVWLGGLVGLLVVFGRVPRRYRVAALGRLVPRFSRVAFVAVMVLLSTGVVYAIVHLPTLGALWQTSYGVSKGRGARRRRGDAPSSSRERRGGDRGRHPLRRRHPLEPPTAVQRPRRDRQGERERRPRPGKPRGRARPLPPRLHDRSEPGGAPELVRRADHEGRRAGAGRAGCDELRDARHGHAPAGLHADRARPRRVRAPPLAAAWD